MMGVVRLEVEKSSAIQNMKLLPFTSSRQYSTPFSGEAFHPENGPLSNLISVEPILSVPIMFSYWILAFIVDSDGAIILKGGAASGSPRNMNSGAIHVSSGNITASGGVRVVTGVGSGVAVGAGVRIGTEEAVATGSAVGEIGGTAVAGSGSVAISMTSVTCSDWIPGAEHPMTANETNNIEIAAATINLLDCLTIICVPRMVSAMFAF